LREIVARETISGNWKAALALVLADAGQLDEAQELVDDLAVEGFADVPLDLSGMFNLAVRAIPVALLEDAPRAALLLPMLEPYVGSHVVLPSRQVYAGPVAFHVGCLRLVTGDLDGGAALLEQASAEAERIGSPSFRARTLVALARAAAARGGAGATAEVDRLASEAAALARSLGMARVAARAEAARAE
jgi:hypothetical protein